jgi:mono/diheme cytochrome c family protein
MEKAHAAAHQTLPPGGPGGTAPSSVGAGLPPSPLAARGRAIYLTACISCHNPNPKLPGALGPEVYGASLPLLTARILTATYPPNYKPKRPSHTMAPLPHLRAEIPALHAFLNSP